MKFSNRLSSHVAKKIACRPLNSDTAKFLSGLPCQKLPSAFHIGMPNEHDVSHLGQSEEGCLLSIAKSLEDSETWRKAINRDGSHWRPLWRLTFPNEIELNLLDLSRIAYLDCFKAAEIGLISKLMLKDTSSLSMQNLDDWLPEEAASLSPGPIPRMKASFRLSNYWGSRQENFPSGKLRILKAFFSYLAECHETHHGIWGSVLSRNEVLVAGGLFQTVLPKIVATELTL